MTLTKACFILQVEGIVFVRIEQLAPFPFDRIAQAVANFPDAELVWVQEEPKNMGAYNYVAPRLKTALRQLNSDTSRYCN